MQNPGEGFRMLEREIHARRNDVLNALDQRYVHPRSSRYRIADIRSSLSVLEGLVIAYLYTNGILDGAQYPAEVTEELNDAAMMWLSVDLIKMRDRAYPKKGNHDEVQGG